MSCGECVKPLLPAIVEQSTLCPNEIYKNFKDAIVNVNAIPKFTYNIPYTTGGVSLGGLGATGTALTALGAINLTGSATGGIAGSAVPILPLNYSGFLYEANGYIVSSSTFLFAFFLALFYNEIYYAAQTASGATWATLQANTNNLSTGSILLNIDQVIQIIFDPNNPRSVSDFFDIFVTLYNVNNCCKAYVYRAYVVGVDFDTGIAVYRIDPCDPWNKCCVPIRKHIYLKWGNSKCYYPGSGVHIIASQAQQSPLCMSSGTVVNNNNVITNGSITYEAILTDAIVLNGSEGAPILDQCGYVVGVVTGRTGAVVGSGNLDVLNNHLNGTIANVVTSQQGTAFGVTCAFISQVVDKLILNDCKPGCTDYVIYNDIYGFSLYRHATLGISYYYRTGAEVGLFGCDVVYPPDIERWYDPAYCNINRQIIGIVIRAVTGSLADAYEDCRAQQFPVFQNKQVIPPPIDFIGFQVEYQDVITGLNGLPVGQLQSQITPDTLLYQLRPCDTINVEFLKASESYTHCHSLCTALDDSLNFLFNLPQVYNPVAGAVTFLNNSQYIDVVIWFFLGLPQVERQYVLSLAAAGNIQVIIPGTSASSANTFGQALINALVAGQAKLFVDPFSLYSQQSAAAVVPAFAINLNYTNNYVNNNTQFVQSFYQNI
jgi:hypothetical protein